MAFIKIKITDKIKDLAKKNKYAELTNGKDYILPTSKFLAGENNYQNYIAEIGELIFEKFLKDNSILYKKDRLYTNRGDYFDFIIDDITFDIKTAHFKFDDYKGIEIGIFPVNYNFFIAEHQINKKIDCYVNIQIDKNIDWAYIVGFIFKKDLQKYSIVKTENMKCPAISIPINELNDMKVFTSYFKKLMVEDYL